MSLQEQEHDTREDNWKVPPRLKHLAAIGWRVLVIVAVAYVLAMVLLRLRLLVVPLFGALLITALIAPVVDRLSGWGLPRLAAVWMSVVSSILFLLLIIGAVVPAVLMEVDDLDTNFEEGWERTRQWLIDGPLGISEQQIDEWVAELGRQISENRSDIMWGVLDQASVGIEVVVGLILMIPVTFFFLKDGLKIWNWCLGWVVEEHRPRVDTVGRRSFQTLSRYVRGELALASIDAVFIGIGLFLIGVPLLLPLVLITFFGSLVPLVGATVSGIAAVVVALLTLGPLEALLVLGVVLLVQQLEGNVVAPLLLGKAAELHPLVVLAVITAGGILGGVIGAFLSVPLAAVASVLINELRRPNDLLLSSEDRGESIATYGE
ncbi:MAG: AI-2E family transporter [Dehalococcoidia bacterium]